MFSARAAASRGGKTRHMLPDGKIVSESEFQRWMTHGAGAEEKGSTLFREAECGLSEGNEVFSDGKSALQNSRQKWANLLQPLTVQGLVMKPSDFDKSIKVPAHIMQC